MHSIQVEPRRLKYRRPNEAETDADWGRQSWAELASLLSVYIKPNQELGRYYLAWSQRPDFGSHNITSMGAGACKAN